MYALDLPGLGDGPRSRNGGASVRELRKAPGPRVDGAVVEEQDEAASAALVLDLLGEHRVGADLVAGRFVELDVLRSAPGLDDETALPSFGEPRRIGPDAEGWDFGRVGQSRSAAR